jgi:23S rRNA (adenine1618-N6)-methyltransferase
VSRSVAVNPTTCSRLPMTLYHEWACLLPGLAQCNTWRPTEVQVFDDIQEGPDSRSRAVMIKNSLKEQLHPRNRFRAGYDFGLLISGSPGLAAFVTPNAYGDESIDYANPEAVKALNRALLKSAYGLDLWDIPPGYLCPAIPGRSDYIHHVADLLMTGDNAAISRERSVTVLDIGMGANCIYPLIGASEYGWRFIGSEIDPVALRWARKLVAANPATSARR